MLNVFKGIKFNTLDSFTLQKVVHGMCPYCAEQSLKTFLHEKGKLVIKQCIKCRRVYVT